MNRALVIGGGFCGLVAAKVLSRHFGQVIVLEKDILPQLPEARKGVPQSNHLHWLMIRGRRILEELFPGIDSQIASLSCPERDQIRDVRSYVGEAVGFAQRFESGLTLRSCSRPLLETVIRQNVKSIPAISFMEGLLVTGMTGDRKKINEVLAWNQNLSADLIVDTSGRGSLAPRWMEQLTGQKVLKSVLDAQLGYCTRTYRVPKMAAFFFEQDLLVANQYPHNPRNGLIRRIEHDLVQVMLVGYAGVHPPSDEQGFENFARQMAHPLIYEAIQKLEPVSPVHTFKNTSNRIFHYEKLKFWPENLIVMGDAFCSLNPFYGQGMTASLVACQLLNKRLEKHKPLGKAFQKKLAATLQPFWEVARHLDEKWIAVNQKKLNPIRRMAIRLKEEMLLLSYKDPRYYVRATEVRNHLRTPLGFLTPRFVVRALAQTARSLL